MSITINNNQPKTVVTNNSTNSKSSIKKSLNEKFPLKSEEKDNALTVAAGLSILAGLGVAMLYRENVIRFFRKSYNNIRKAIQGKGPDLEKDIRPHGGPEIDFEKYGSQAIMKSWDKYIANMEKRLSKHDQIQRKYDAIFTNDAKRADELEAKARKEVLKRGDIWK